MPSAAEAEVNLAWLRRHGFPRLELEEMYVAPHYERGSGVSDPVLLERLEACRPEFVFLNIGGGAQEPLGAWLKAHLSYQPAIVCTGAAVAFRSGAQASIPRWADALYLGWLLRILGTPKVFWPRYWKAWKLAARVFRFGPAAPPISPH
jgi:UDP-N-acetyl-D-mannosaminuronic acid transferase (WecB/TagA/CpsF family)